MIVRALFNLKTEVEVTKKTAHALILKTAVGSRKSAQHLDAPRKCTNRLITQKVTTQFVHSLCTSIVCTAFSRPTAVFRLKADGGHGIDVSDV